MLLIFFQNKCLSVAFAVFVCALLFAAGCKNKSFTSPGAYSLDEPVQTQLGKVLNEISGIAYNAADTSMLAIADNKEWVFLMDLKNVKLHDYTAKVVPKNSDLEDLVKIDTSIYLLMSKGILLEVPDRATDSAAVKQYALPLGGSNDFETLYFDPDANGLVLLCKTCAHEKGEGIRTAFRFDLRTKTFDSTAFYTIKKEDVAAMLKNTEAKFDPAAAAIHPLEKRLYIISSAGNLLVITDTKGKVLEAYNLNPDLYPQAEGIAFAPNGDMYITNEGKYGVPTLFYFPYKKKGKKK